MSLTIRVWWPDAVYDAAALNPAVAEWPPAPGRLFAALRASTRARDAMPALEWLEQQAAPIIFADANVVSDRLHSGYVVINAVDQQGGNLTHPGRTNGARVRLGTCPRDPRVAFVWPAASPTPETVHELVDLAHDVPYLGRSTAPAVLTVDVSDPPVEGSHWAPTSLGRGSVQLPVPYAGFTAELEDAFKAGARAWERYRLQDYRFVDPRTPTKPPPPSTSTAPYAAPLVFRLPRGIRLSGTALGAVTAALRRAVMSRAADPLLPEISGHEADGRPHVAYLGLIDIGHAHAAGDILALALCSPEGRPDVQAALAEATLDPRRPLETLRIPGIGELALEYNPVQDRPVGATPGRWTRPARTWITATPLVLDRYPRRSLTEHEVVAAGLAAAGYPRPVSVELSTSSFALGGLHLRRHQVPRRTGDHRPVRHARVTFLDDVAGPVLGGALRHLGFGLFAPDRSQSLALEVTA